MDRALLSIALLQGLTILVALVRAKVLAGLLGPAHVGIVSIVDQVVLMLVSLGSLSLTFTATKFMSHSHSLGRAQFEATSAGFLRILGALAVVTTAVASIALAVHPGVFGRALIPYHFLVQLALLGIPAVMLHMLLVNTLAAAQRPTSAAGLTLLVALGLAVSAVVGVLLHGLVGLYLATGGVGILGLVGSIHYLRRSVGVRLTDRTVPVWSELGQHRNLLSVTGSIYVAQAVYAVTMLAIRYVVLSRMGESATGLFQASSSIALTVGAVLAPMSNFFLIPLVNRQIPVTDKVRAAHEFAGRMLALLFLAALPIVLLPDLLLGLLYTGEFVAAAATLAFFVLWQCVFQIANIYQQLLIGLDDVRFMALASIGGFASAMALTLALVPRFGLAGPAVALGTGMFGYGAAAAVRLRARHGVGVPRRLVVRAVLLGLMVILAGLLFGAARWNAVPDIPGRLAFAGCALGLLWLSLATTERRFVLDAPRALLRSWHARRVPVELR